MDSAQGWTKGTSHIQFLSFQQYISACCMESIDLEGFCSPQYSEHGGAPGKLPT